MRCEEQELLVKYYKTILNTSTLLLFWHFVIQYWYIDVYKSKFTQAGLKGP